MIQPPTKIIDDNKSKSNQINNLVNAIHLLIIYSPYHL